MWIKYDGKKNNINLSVGLDELSIPVSFGKWIHVIEGNNTVYVDGKRKKLKVRK